MPSTSENRLKVRDAWKKGGMYHATNFETVGGVVYSYHHVIGITEPDGTRVAFDCHYSRMTSTHCHVLFPAANDIRTCPKHPKGVKDKGPVPEDSAMTIIAKGNAASSRFMLNEAARLRVGIQDAIRALLDTECTVSLQPGVINICDGPDKPQDMLTCSKCWVIVGLRNVLEGKLFDAKPSA